MYVQLKCHHNNKTEWSGRYVKKKAINLQHSSMVRYCKLAPYKLGNDYNIGYFDPEPMLKLIGFFIGDGSITSNGNINFHLKKKRKIDYLKELCVELNVELHHRVGDNYLIKESLFKEFFEQFYKSKQKHIPQEFKELNQQCSSWLLDGLRNSDGSQKRGAWTYLTSVRDVSEAVQLIALHAGLELESWL